MKIVLMMLIGGQSTCLDGGNGGIEIEPVDGGAEHGGAARHGRFHRHFGHVRLRGSQAEPVGAPVHQPVRRDDAALFQHAHFQVVDRVVPRGGHPVRAGTRLRR